MMTRVGELTFDVPQVRGGGFYPSALEKGSRTEQALNIALGRDVRAGRVHPQGDYSAAIAAWGPRCRSRRPRSAVPRSSSMPACRPGVSDRFDETPYLFLDARYERVREGGRLVDCAVLVAVGITQGWSSSGARGVSVALSEAEVHWRAFLDSLVRRGLKGVKMIVSDAHAGLNAARRATLPSVPWQRCQFHLQQNAQSYVTRLDQRKPVAQRIRAIFNAPDRDRGRAPLAKQAIEAWRTEAPKLAQWAEENLLEGFTAFELASCPTRPPAHHQRPRTH
jgi:putative transposase